MIREQLQDWRGVWQKRSLDSESPLSLQSLLELDGFGATEPQAWFEGVARIRTRLRARKDDTIFDVGCGAGAFLYPLVSHFGHRVGGIDYSEALVATARRVMPGMPFVVEEAKRLEIEEPYDFVVAHSTYQYFPSLAYAGKVLQRMIAKSRKAVAVLDVSDVERREELEALRRGSLPRGEYETRYAGLDHMYYRRQWFHEFAQAAGMTAEVLEQDIPTYAVTGLRFNVILRRT